mmetsp:Transcript_130054/g.324179  ORF Transcript_130054/g.324179 Transcript_130054/m.324179 type:complete len:224 (-) Transcript_130054:330-1001(-)
MSNGCQPTSVLALSSSICNLMPRIMASTSSPAACVRRMTCAASSPRPCSTSQCGDSGMKRTARPMIAAGASTPESVIARQLRPGGKPDSTQFTTKPIVRPMLIANVTHVVNLPRCWAGAVSAMYIGLMGIPMPMLMPHTIRPRSNAEKDCAQEHQPSPAMVSACVKTRLRKRPKRSVIVFDRSPPKVDVNAREAKNKPSCMSFNSKSLLTKTPIPALTPMLNP